MKDWTVEDITALLDTMGLAQALWWFIENAPDDERRTDIFFYLRERVRSDL